MNDFTKDELEDIQSWGKAWCVGSKLSEIATEALRHKIDFMIDDYREPNTEKNFQKPFEKSLDDLLDYIEKELLVVGENPSS